VEQGRKKEKKQTIIPTRDNLKFKTLAKYRALKDGDVIQYENIDDLYIENKTAVKGIAFKSDSMEKFEIFKQNKLYESENLSFEHSDDARRWDETTLQHQARLGKKKQ